ncbi:MAG TPA: cyclic nucleotide-binding domain-containing protein [Trebonia sp.]
MFEVTGPDLAGHTFLRGMPPGRFDVLAATATGVMFPAGQRIFADGGYAGRFWLVRCGSVTLDLLVPGEGPVIVDCVGIGGLLGWSWLFPPYRWAFGAVCASPVEAFEFDAAAVRGLCAADPALGYDLTTRLSRVLAGRLQSTRIRLIARPQGARIEQ